jgi:hypothetical protein
MKRIAAICLSLLVSLNALGVPEDALHKEIRKIRRAYLDVIELLPTQEEIDWYVVYNKNGYEMAVDFLVSKAPDEMWNKSKLTANEYVEAPVRVVERQVLEKNIVYLAGLWRGEMSEALLAEATDQFIKKALLATDENPSNAIDYMVNLLTCRPSSAEEENELMQIFNKVSLKSDEMSAWKTVLLHILEMNDCKTK